MSGTKIECRICHKSEGSMISSKLGYEHYQQVLLYGWATGINPCSPRSLINAKQEAKKMRIKIDKYLGNQDG